jgi:hypothetical protein
MWLSYTYKATYNRPKVSNKSVSLRQLTVIVDVVAAAVAILIGEGAAGAIAVLIGEAAAFAKKCGGRLFLPAPASVLIEDQVKGGPRNSKHGMGLLQY